mmetsp:Transcript_51648/g.77072  ORF Transcript_51648/g.77072 Transcript_51648/m.77072 type:complete len:370 (-) Transcript_51648:127-1236(-)
MKFLRDLAVRNYKWDAPYATSPIGTPELVLHGGDLSHTWGCENHDGCRNVGDEMNEVWDILYDARIPMVSSFGNHDWATAIGTGNEDMWNSANPREARDEWIEANLVSFRTYDQNNRVTMDFVDASYVKSHRVAGSNLVYEPFRPKGTPGQTVYGQSMYKITFRGIQIASFNCAANWESYDDRGVYSAEDQLSRLSSSLDKNKPTIFFSHYPIDQVSDGTVQDKMKDLIWSFPDGSHHFSGHTHVQTKRTYYDTSSNPPKSFSDFTAPYPHEWRGRDPGVYAVLASPTQGILQVKTINIPGLSTGDACGEDCGRCHEGFSSRYQGNRICGRVPCRGSGAKCNSVFGQCNECCNGKAPCAWYRFGFCRCR